MFLQWFVGKGKGLRWCSHVVAGVHPHVRTCAGSTAVSGYPPELTLEAGNPTVRKPHLISEM